jgi:DNA-binding transcriptional ArsR family regulator
MHGKATGLAGIFRVMGDRSRLAILIACLERPICVSDIALATGLSPSLVSHHLRRLRLVRLVAGSRRGRQVFYAAADAHVRRVVTDMADHVAEKRRTVRPRRRT